jgi:RND family efflux transporter MFP subunit
LSETRRKIIIPIVILVAGAIITVIMVKSRAPVQTRPPVEYAPVVRVVPVEMESHQLIVTTHGTVSPRTESALVGEVSGRVVSIAPNFASGGFFEKGEIMVTIDPVDYELAVITARSQVAQAKVRAETEEAQARVAREEWRALGDGGDSPLATRELQLQEAKAALDAAAAALKKAERDLERTRVRAPFVCRVRAKLADVGRFITPGVPVAQVYAIDYAEVRLPIPDAELAHLDLPSDYRGTDQSGAGPEVRLHATYAGERATWRGRVVRLEGEIDPVTRMVHVVAQVDDPYRRSTSGQPPLSVGLFVEAEIMGLQIDDAVVLPRSALRGDGTVLVVDDENRLRFRSVDVVRTEGTTAVVSDGLREGERICVSTLEAVTDGMKVRVADEGVEDEGDAANAPPQTSGEVPAATEEAEQTSGDRGGER